VANFSPLTVEIGSGVLGTPANFNGFRILPLLLQRRRSLEANQICTMFGICWAGTLHIDFWGLLPPDRILPSAKFTLHPSLAFFCWQRYCTALQQRPSATLCGIVQQMELRNFRRGCHLYSTGRPSRWALARILVMVALCNRADHYIFALWLLSFFFLA